MIDLNILCIDVNLNELKYCAYAVSKFMNKYFIFNTSVTKYNVNGIMRTPMKEIC